MTKLEAVKHLAEFDHQLLSPQGIKDIGEPFNYYRTEKYTDTRSEFKGLTLSGEHKEGDVVDGLEAHIIAMDLCKLENVDYRDMFGVGSQLRECCARLIEHLEK